ncbi:MAG: ribonuclease Z [Thermoplasmataceae archaeon]
MASNIRIAFLGTGGSWPKPGQSLPSVAIQIDDILNLFDCGEGTQKQLMKSTFSFMKIRNVFITHFHGDHFLGIIGLIQSMSFNGREEPLYIYGPIGTAAIMSRALGIGYYRLTFPVELVEISFGESVQFEKFRVDTMKTDHPVPAMAYRVCEPDLIKIDGEKAKKTGIPSRLLEELRKKGSLNHNGKIISIDEVSSGIRKGRVIVYTGDTRPMKEMKEFSRDADVLIHETTTDSSFEPKVNEFGHSSSRQASEIARDACVKRLFLFHYSPRIDDKNILLDEAKKIFENSELSYEGLEFELKTK